MATDQPVNANLSISAKSVSVNIYNTQKTNKLSLITSMLEQTTTDVQFHSMERDVSLLLTALCVE